MKVALRSARSLAALLALLTLAAVLPASGQEPPAASPILIDFFFEPGCSECAHVREEILPELRLRYEGFYQLNEYDVGIRENYLRLARYQQRLGSAENAPVSMVVDRSHILSGLAAIREGLFPLLDRLAPEHLAGTATIPPEDAAGGPEAAEQTLGERARAFTLLGILAAGLVDGINPCAISTLIFFVSMLGVFKVGRRQILLVGSSFVAASFLTYLAIGFGLFRALHLLTGFTLVRQAVNWLMLAVLAVFAFLSFRDAWRYQRSKNAHDVSLQLPESVKLRIHKIMRGGLGMSSLFLGSLVIGSAVTVLESVCTGQVYIPTLVMLIKKGEAGVAGFLYLLLYNVMFQVPIITVFLLVLQGMRTASLLAWSRHHVVVSKILLGLFFVTMGVLILAL